MLILGKHFELGLNHSHSLIRKIGLDVYNNLVDYISLNQNAVYSQDNYNIPQ